MIIATNTPLSFPLRGGYRIVNLGDEVEKTSVVVLMLSKNWGASYIDQIESITYWLSRYPPNTPCYLIGAESTSPDMNLKKYTWKSRDDAVRRLCDEVLRRSRSVGVRGEITYAYLTEMLGYPKESVDLIYLDSDGDNYERVRKFIEKNECPLSLFERPLADFQKAPVILYERPIDYTNEIVIGSQHVENRGQVSRLNSEIVIDNRRRTLWCEVSALYAQYILVERADACLSVLLPFAMRTKKDIVCELPVTEQFLHNLTEILIPQLCEHDARLHAVNIQARGESRALLRGNAVATGMSCGVDSLYTANLYLQSQFESMRLTHLYAGNYLYGNDNAIHRRAHMVAGELNLPLVTTATNINEELRLPHLYTHFFKTMFGVLAIRKMFRSYYYSSAEDISHFNIKGSGTSDTAIFELLLLYCFSCWDFQIIPGGVKSERLEKTRAIAGWIVAHKFLNVCLYPSDQINCGKCAKCMRTLLMLDMIGSLDAFTAVFDIEEYRRTRLESFVYLAQEKNSIMLSQVYLHFMDTEPALVREAEKSLEKARPRSASGA